jgi:hypothetical protein
MVLQVQLTPLEFIHAAHAGFLRQTQNLLHQRRDTHGFNGDGWSVHVMGALGEFACAKALGLFWSGPGKMRASDVGAFQVRTVARDKDRLILHEEDADDAVFVLVQQVSACEWKLVGWIIGRDGKLQRFWDDPRTGRPAFFVPRESLHDDFVAMRSL